MSAWPMSENLGFRQLAPTYANHRNLEYLNSVILYTSIYILIFLYTYIYIIETLYTHIHYN